MNTKLNKSDYALLGIFYLISATINVFDYLDQDAKIIEYLIDIPTYIFTSLFGVLVFMYFIIPRYLVNQKKYLQFALLGILTVLIIGVIERIVGFATGDNNW